MQGINTRKVSHPYVDPGFVVVVFFFYFYFFFFFLGGGGVQACLPENNPNTLIPGGGVLI